MKKFLILAILYLLFTLSFGFCVANAGPVEPTELIDTKIIKGEFNNSQFLINIGHKKLVEEFLFIIDHSIYTISIDNWNSFIKNYKQCYSAIKAYKQGWNVEFDDILN